MDEAIFKDGSSWFYSEEPSYFIAETSQLVDDIVSVLKKKVAAEAEVM